MKKRFGFVSNSSSSSFVLFGTELEYTLVDKLVENYIKTSMVKHYGSLDKVPDLDCCEEFSDEYIYHLMIEDENYINDMCSWEKAEMLELNTNGDEIYIGFSPTWFKKNPWKTWNDAVDIHTQKYIEIGLVEDDIKFNYVEG